MFFAFDIFQRLVNQSLNFTEKSVNKPKLLNRLLNFCSGLSFEKGSSSSADELYENFENSTRFESKLLF